MFLIKLPELNLPWVKRMQNSFKYHWKSRVGIGGAMAIGYYHFLKALGFKVKDKCYPIQTKGVAHFFSGRFDTSDGAVFHQIFIQREYACLNGIEKPKLIVDCGANVGYSALWFLNYYPTAHVIAVEPHDGNFDLCQKNLKQYGDRVTLIHAAVWPYETGLIGEANCGKEWAFQVRKCREDEKPDLYGIGIEQILQKSNFRNIDILKIDIETAEKKLFSENYENWIGKVKNIVIELHNPECEEVFFKAMSGFDYDLSKSGELTVCKNIVRRVYAVR